MCMWYILVCFLNESIKKSGTVTGLRKVLYLQLLSPLTDKKRCTFQYLVMKVNTADFSPTRFTIIVVV